MCNKQGVNTRQDVNLIIKDGGWAWVIAFSAFVCRILHDGIVKGYGVLLPTLSIQLDTKVWEVGFAVSLMVVVGSILVLIAGPSINELQPRFVLIGSGVFVFLGFILCACATSFEMFAFSLILITGIPLRMSWYIMLSIQGEYFDKHYAAANSIAYSGSSVAVVIFAPMTQFLLNSFGWRGTLLVLASITLNISVCGAIVKLRPKYDPTDGYINLDKHEKFSIKHAMFTFFKKVFDPMLLNQPNFWGTLAAEFAFQYSWTGWMIYLNPYARSIGLSPYQSTYLSSAGGFGSLIGTIAIIFVLKASNNLIIILLALLLITGISLQIYAFSISLYVLITVSFTYGLALNGGLVAVLSMSKSLKGELSHAVSWLFLASALGRLLAGFFTGWIKDATNSYTISFTVLGGVLLSAAIVFGALLVIQRRTK